MRMISANKLRVILTIAMYLVVTVEFTVAQGSVRGGVADEGHNPGPSISSSSQGILHRELNEQSVTIIGGHGQPVILKVNTPGALGRIDLKALSEEEDHDKAGTNMNDIVHDRLLSALGGSGTETLVQKSLHWDDGADHERVHVRFLQSVHGILVEGSALVVHADARDGSIESINGELVVVERLTEDLLMTMIGVRMESYAHAQLLLDQALMEAGLEHGKWSDNTQPELAVVRRAVDGTACLAWKRLYEYNVAQTDDNQNIALHIDMIFADATAGVNESKLHHNIFRAAKPYPILCASHPKVMGSGIPSLETYDCQQSVLQKDCTLVTKSTRPIFTADEALNAAHNHALATYNYFWREFGRDSLDGAGMTLKSRVHYGVNVNNAFWRQADQQVSYGDGDGVLFLPLSFALDVVAHELCHGWTSSTSALIYRGESGALNEAMSDIFAALVEKNENRKEAEIWMLGETIYTPGRPGDGLRNLKDPSSTGGFDFYPRRYKLDGDYGGVHLNSGIANLAFYLLVKGGIHPRRTTTVVVPAIGYTNAAHIFYHANVDCLTPSSTFYIMRVCTADVFGGPYSEAVHLAWDAVGVPRDPPPVIQLRSAVPLQKQAGTYWEVLRYTMGPVYRGEKVFCATNANNGDADLYLKWDSPAEPNPRSVQNDCFSYSYGSREQCTTDVAVSNSQQLHVAVHAYRSFSNLSIRCRIIPANAPTRVPNPAPTRAPVVAQPTNPDDISNDDPPSWM